MRRSVVVLVVLFASGWTAVRIRGEGAQREAFEAARRRLDDGVMRIAVMGDSVAHGAGDETGAGIAGALHAVNLGVDGARTMTVLSILQRSTVLAVLRASDVVVISIGGNDAFGDSLAKLRTMLLPSVSAIGTIDRMQTIVSRIRSANPAARIVLLGLYNPYKSAAIGSFLDRQIALWDARLIERFASDRQVDVIRIADLIDGARSLSTIDHFHPGAAGYAAIAARIAATLPNR